MDDQNNSPVAIGSLGWIIYAESIDSFYLNIMTHLESSGMK